MLFEQNSLVACTNLPSRITGRSHTTQKIEGGEQVVTTGWKVTMYGMSTKDVLEARDAVKSYYDSEDPEVAKDGSPQLSVGKEMFGIRDTGTQQEKAERVQECRDRGWKVPSQFSLFLDLKITYTVENASYKDGSALVHDFLLAMSIGEWSPWMFLSMEGIEIEAPSDIVPMIDFAGATYDIYLWLDDSACVAAGCTKDGSSRDALFREWLPKFNMHTLVLVISKEVTGHMQEVSADLTLSTGLTASLRRCLTPVSSTSF